MAGKSLSSRQGGQAPAPVVFLLFFPGGIAYSTPILVLAWQAVFVGEVALVIDDGRFWRPARQRLV